MRRSAQSWNGWAPPPAMRTLSTRASCTTASRTFSNSSRRVVALACTELFSSTMLSVISGFTAPGSLRLPSRRNSSSASRAKSKSCGRTSCSSSSTPNVSGADALKASSSIGMRLARAAQGELRRERAEELEDHHRRQHHRSELAAERRIEERGVPHHHHRRARKRKQAEREQAGAAGADAGKRAEAQQRDGFAEEAHKDEGGHRRRRRDAECRELEARADQHEQDHEEELRAVPEVDRQHRVAAVEVARQHAERQQGEAHRKLERVRDADGHHHDPDHENELALLALAQPGGKAQHQDTG